MERLFVKPDRFLGSERHALGILSEPGHTLARGTFCVIFASLSPLFVTLVGVLEVFSCILRISMVRQIFLFLFQVAIVCTFVVQVLLVHPQLLCVEFRLQKDGVFEVGSLRQWSFVSDSVAPAKVVSEEFVVLFEVER